MSQLRAIAKSLLPLRVRRSLRGAYRGFVFRRAMRKFLRAPDSCAQPGNPVLSRLIYGWGNESWSADDDYVVACIEHASVSIGPILECGSGLSTILVGLVAKRRGLDHWVLEHTPEWASKVRTCLNRYAIDSVVLCEGPLRDYGEFSWYDPPLESMPDNFGTVICDGPPGSTKGGRYGLAAVMGKRLGPGCVILLDDAGRDEETAIAERWEAELGAHSETLGHAKPYVRMTVKDKEHGNTA